ncbi:MAG TPA: DUF881 domain-containing protein [Anaerolineae bacterium]|nr:DUF881 domain-containing protein [Anaerolineae bacterium]
MNLRKQLALTVVCFLLGVGLVAQLRARRGQNLPTTALSADQSALLGSLVVTNAELRGEVQKLQSEIQSYQVSEERTVPQMMDDLGRMRLINGSVGATGGGVEVRVGGTVDVFSLQDLVNEVRNAGAEAISLNGFRITIRTSLSADSRSITVDGQPIEPPYMLQAIGDPTTMATALTRRGGQLQIMQGSYPGLEVTVKTAQRLVLPAVREQPVFTLAKPAQ